MNTPDDHAHVVQDLIEPVNRYIHNPIAAKIVKFLQATRVTPNQVTYASICIGLIAAWIFSLGAGSNMILAGCLLELVLVLDCVDGQLARAKGCSSDWGRLLDGIAGYIIYLAVLFGIMAGLKNYYTVLIVIGVVTILKAISYDYCKLSMITMIQDGYDGNQKEIFDTHRKIMKNSSAILKVYFSYLQAQQVIFGGQWVSLGRYGELNEKNFDENLLTVEQRGRYRDRVKNLMAVWSWNGVDFPLFLLAGFSVFGVLEACLVPLAYFLATQFLLTMLYHRMKMKFQADVEGIRKAERFKSP